MKPIVVLATRNKNKVREILAILAESAIDFKTLDDFPGAPEVIEGADTLEENAAKKAKSAALYCGRWALADDTGLEVDSLGGKPGVLSARYAGPGSSYADNNRKLLAALDGVPHEKRTARFRCAVALASAGGSTVIMEGCLEGFITREPSGSRGFGYDPVFAVAASSADAGRGQGPVRTLAELSPLEKNAVSHRAAALKKIIPYLRRLKAEV
ncbi:MAG: RdgB/HAM1 family non-canonical purine NTP pyrophosphatase [Elusimicrobia bacterium]|nr:RdgB/HAM1 family non-canonical purine NTP pyrophosphatase [Elusimicrobiota bacterium]